MWQQMNNIQKFGFITSISVLTLLIVAGVPLGISYWIQGGLSVDALAGWALGIMLAVLS